MNRSNRTFTVVSRKNVNDRCMYRYTELKEEGCDLSDRYRRSSIHYETVTARTNLTLELTADKPDCTRFHSVHSGCTLGRISRRTCSNANLIQGAGVFKSSKLSFNNSFNVYV